ncbi:MAG: ferrous iron transport protein B [Planctomycetes bacterium]|nr:ferrous iron transport protein B [Planctomycetota bacterium]MCB9935450.1 ferrous iron transport protein B [Planctomycetota bacterium]
MTESSTSTRHEGHARHDRHAIALMGNPNTGKSSLFNALTGARQKIANFPGVTVEAKIGTTRFENSELTIIDLPGTYSLAARSPDERVATDALLGRIEGTPKPDGVVIVLDASSLDRNLYIGTQVLEFGLPAVVALTMLDVAESRGIKIDTDKLARTLGVPVVVVNAPKGVGIDELKSTLHRTLHHPGKRLELSYPDDFKRGVDTLHAELCDLGVKLGFTPTRPEALRLLVDGAGPFFDECEEVGGEEWTRKFFEIRDRAAAGRSLSMLEAQTRYGAIGQWMREVKQAEAREGRTRTDVVDGILTHKLWGSLVFIVVMGLIFQSIYSWSGPLMDAIDGGFGALGDWVGGMMGEGALKSLVVDGVIAGVGGVLIFLPQILILFLFIAILEDLGYMSRAAFLMDRLMSRFGLSGKAFIPLLSSFACNIPGIMGARVIEDRNTRLTTIFLAPFMSCSARLPVYTLFIAAFVPQIKLLGFLELQGVVLFAMYWVGVLFAIPTALVLKKGILKSKVTPFLLELPSYKMPRPRAVGRVLWERGGSFVRRAGTIILAVSVLVWAAGYFPRSAEIDEKYDTETSTLEKSYVAAVVKFKPDEDSESLLAQFKAIDDAHEKRVSELEGEKEEIKAATAESERQRDSETAELASKQSAAHADYENWKELAEKRADIDNRRAGEHLENSILGRMGHAIEPAVTPLGWDWRIGMAAIASFPAREVIVATLGTIFNLGSGQEAESEPLRKVVQDATRPDGSKLFSLATGLSIMVFFALCAQCAATLAVMRRETNSWKWPLASFAYMTTLAYLAALVTFQVASALGG